MGGQRHGTGVGLGCVDGRIIIPFWAMGRGFFFSLGSFSSHVSYSLTRSLRHSLWAFGLGDDGGGAVVREGRVETAPAVFVPQNIRP